MEDYYKNKRVCFVGPASSIKQLSQRELIDSYDVVCRPNKALPLPESLHDSSGTKTNVLYNCLDPDPMAGGPYNIGLWQKLDWLVCPYPKIPPFDFTINMFERANSNGQIRNFRLFDEAKYKKIVSEVKTRPNSGFLAILDILSFDIKELYVTGVTFFQGVYVKEYRGISEEKFDKLQREHGNHIQEPQIEYMKNVFRKDSRVKGDRFLNEILCI